MAHARRIDPGDKLDLSKVDTSPNSLTREKAEAKTDKLGQELAELTDLLNYAGTESLLVVLQGMDTSGKDGTLRHLLRHIDALGTRVVGFKAPTEEELAHDFLWRVHREVPARGRIALFNRSHYEDVAVVRVHQLVPEAVWRKRYDRIREFEKLLRSGGTIVVKFFLHISKEEQKRRLLEREQDVVKSWKLSVGDWQERKLWQDYQAAWDEAIARTTTDHAPWFVVPADKKWYRDLVVTEVLVDLLRPRREGWVKHLEKVGEKARAELKAYRDRD